jgi:glutamate/tyrosine decarboxylase-like PLP-dependent enzyme
VFAIRNVILPGLSHWQHPDFFGYFPSNGELSSVLGDFLSTGLGVLGLSWQSSPALTELEEVVTDWVRQLVGLGPAWRGVIQDTASSSTLVALLCARERASDSRWHGGQAHAAPWSSTFVAAGSVEKAALLADRSRQSPRDPGRRMPQCPTLALAIEADLRPAACPARSSPTAAPRRRRRSIRSSALPRRARRPLAARRCRDGGSG